MVVNSIIGKGSSFKGDLITDELIRLEGDFTGMIKNEKGTILLGHFSRFKGNIYSRDLTISGIFKGSLYITSKLFITSGAVVIGSIYAKFLEVEKGALLSVDVMMNFDDMKEDVKDNFKIENKLFSKKFIDRDQVNTEDNSL